jgi:hypothetical protein
MQDTLQPGDLVLGDAFYPTYFFVAAMTEAAPQTLSVTA